MKRLLCIICSILVLTLGSLPGQAAAASPIRVLVDGVPVNFSSEPLLKNGTTLVEFRPIFEKLGYEISWVPETKTVVGTKGDLKIELSIGDKNARVTNTATQASTSQALSVAPEINLGRTLVPLRFIGEASGAEVLWNTKEDSTGSYNEISINLNKHDTPAEAGGFSDGVALNSFVFYTGDADKTGETSFERQESGDLKWDCGLTYASAAQENSLTLKFVFYDDKGTLMNEQSEQVTTKANETAATVTGSLPWSRMKAWADGQYRMEILLGNRKLAEKSLTLAAAKDGSESKLTDAQGVALLKQLEVSPVKLFGFETSNGALWPLERRVYATTFGRTQCDAIGWQLEISYPESLAGQDIVIPVTVRVERAPGHFIASEYEMDFKLDPGTTSKMFDGYSYYQDQVDQFGKTYHDMQAGKYHIVFTAFGRFLAEGDYTIE